MHGRRLAAAVVLTLATAAPVLSVPAAAQAAVPAVATSYSSLMYRSLTADATMASLRLTLKDQQRVLAVRAGEVSVATRAEVAAQKTLSAVSVTHQGVHDRLKAAERALTDANNVLKKVSKQRPVKKSAVTKARKAVAAATVTRDQRRKKLHEAAVPLRAAQAGVRSATVVLRAAATAHTTAATAVTGTQRRIANQGTAAEYATRAAALSRGVVDQVRPAFTVADTTSVYGVTVHRTVAFAFKRMVDDAAAAGVVISGGGFRTKERQIELRKINGCPDVWTAPASSCRVPTAIPGRSLHEIGLAVDISSGGKTISRKTKAFTWLQANAAKYGYVNLPSEAWHWSITGG
ncbi:D-alanyl-D-alanine carboxypeptidase family protein [Actinoplanes sp. G11-F43]|uniref:M15 family metallopeptidase n=1 Tax=Actinoplanes sp. G11-F43 TaxID=3424130 RepID=UPI003D351F99